MIAFGPVPSRRLGRSLGINNIPSKVCSYSCVYCQVGRTHRLQMDRRFFFEPGEILRDVKIRLVQAREKSEQVDFLTFVSDGEPTLDRNLGEAIKLLKEGSTAQQLNSSTAKKHLSPFAIYNQFCYTVIAENQYIWSK